MPKNKIFEKVDFMCFTPFSSKLYVVTTNDVVNSTNHAIGKFGIHEPIEKPKGTIEEAFTVSGEGNCDVYVILPIRCSVELIAHEVYHAVCHIAKFAGVKDKEFMAYYIGYLTTKLVKFNADASKKYRMRKR